MTTDPGTEIDRLFRQTPRAGTPDDPEGYIRGGAGDMARGVRVEFWWRVDETVVKDARFEVYGGPAAVAAPAWAAEWVIGRRIEDVARLRGMQIAAALGLAPAAYDQALVVEDALKAAVQAAAPSRLR